LLPCDSLSTYSLSTYSLSTYSLSTYSLSTYSLSTYSLSTYSLSTYSLSTYSLSTYSLSTYSLSAGTHTPSLNRSPPRTQNPSDASLSPPQDNFHIHVPSEHTVGGQYLDGELHYDFTNTDGVVVATIAVLLNASSVTENGYLSQFFSSPFDGSPTEAPVGFNLWDIFPTDGFMVRPHTSLLFLWGR
jgi:hypothetical protein